MIARALLAALLLASPAAAQERLGHYCADIDPADHFSSDGQRLTDAGQILRQDRANFHRFGIRDGGDEGDPFFDSQEARAGLERLVAEGSLNPTYRGWIVNGNPWVCVTVWGWGGRPAFVSVEVPG